jgi:hypothetical protein
MECYWPFCPTEIELKNRLGSVFTYVRRIARTLREESSPSGIAKTHLARAARQLSRFSKYAIANTPRRHLRWSLPKLRHLTRRLCRSRH